VGDYPEHRLIIRSYREPDWRAVYGICVRTADAGGDVSGRYFSDDLVPDVFAGPYLELEPDLAFVLHNGDQPVGYVLGTADTTLFVRSFREKWLPRVAARYPAPNSPALTEDDRMIGLLLRPERMLWSGLSDYPAHLHIDILPDYQGAGSGRRLIETFCEAVTRQGATGIHVCVGASNVRAQGFYRRVGFMQLEAPNQAHVYMGMQLLPGAVQRSRNRAATGTGISSVAFGLQQVGPLPPEALAHGGPAGGPG
jgi:ribosomal protein S18 acetylase RimI-like enzyme